MSIAINKLPSHVNFLISTTFCSFYKFGFRGRYFLEVDRLIADDAEIKFVCLKNIALFLNIIFGTSS